MTTIRIAVIGATFQTLPGASFVVNGAAQASDSALTTASAELKWINGWSTAATFEGEFSDVTALLRRQGRGALRLVTAASAIGAERTLEADAAMSVLGTKADEGGALFDFCF